LICSFCGQLNQLRHALEKQILKQTQDIEIVRLTLESKIKAEVEERIRTHLRELVKDSLREKVRDKVREEVRHNLLYLYNLLQPPLLAGKTSSRKLATAGHCSPEADTGSQNHAS